MVGYIRQRNAEQRLAEGFGVIRCEAFLWLEVTMGYLESVV